MVTTAKHPPLVFDFEQKGQANPIRATYLVAARSVDGELELRESGPRAITVKPRAKAPKFAATIFESIPKSWNEERPIASRGYTPKYEAAKFDDPKKGTPDEKRRGPFSLGVAIETKAPAEWYDDSLTAAQTASSIGAAAGGLGMAATSLLMDPENFAKPGELPERPTLRLVAFGHGGIFVGKDLSPAQEELLLTTVNWQLHRDDLLPKDPPPEDRWQFPREVMSEQQKKLWRWARSSACPCSVRSSG